MRRELAGCRRVPGAAAWPSMVATRALRCATGLLAAAWTGCTPAPRTAAPPATTAPATAPATASAAAHRRPNVLLILADDLGARLGCYGEPVVRTPQIDRLAAMGVRFERAYCQFPLCHPSRSSLLSGRRPDTLQLYGNFRSARHHVKDLLFLPEHFAQFGYRTLRVGKVMDHRWEHEVRWHETYDARAIALGYELPEGDEATTQPLRLDRPPPNLPIRWSATARQDDQEVDGKNARFAAGWLRSRTDAGPFLLAIGFYQPHEPFKAPQRYFDLYPPHALAPTQAPSDDRADIPPVALHEFLGRQEMTEPRRRAATAAYYACVSMLDAQVGLLLDALAAAGRRDDTVIVLASDHGYLLGEHGMWRKLSLFEPCARVPLIVAAPGRQRGAVSPRLVELVDLFPTLCELCGVPPPPGIEGESFAPLLSEPQRAWKTAAFTQVTRPDRVQCYRVRTERFRYSEWPDGATELYDHDADPHEYRNLAGDPSHAADVAELRKLLRSRTQAPASRQVGGRAEAPPRG